MTRVVGYTRPLTTDDTQQDAAALRSAGASVVFTEAVDADPRDRPALADCLSELKAGDVLLISSASRLAHSLRHFLSTTTHLTSAGVEVRSLTEPALCTDGSASPAEVFSALDALRRELIGVTTRTGLAAAANAGRHPGRPSVMSEEMTAIAGELRRVGRSYSHIGRVLGVSAGAVQRALTARPPGSL